jgi:DNA-binding MarR family transcriptional regulator
MAKRKTLGSNQEKIVLYLAEHPEKTMSDMQKEFDIPKNSYNIIHRSTKVLEEMGFISRDEETSVKARPTYPFVLTETGVLYALSKKPNIKDKKKILITYSEIYPEFKRYLALAQELGDKLFSKLSKYLFRSLELFDKKKSKDETIQLGWALAMIFSEEFSDEERDHFFDVIFKLYPEFIPNYNKMSESVIKQLKKYGGVID